MRLPRTPPDPWAVLKSSADPTHARQDILQLALAPGAEVIENRYLHWDELRHREPPAGLNREQWWAVTKLARQRASTRVEPMASRYSLPFHFVSIPRIQRSLHELDRDNIARDLIQALGDDDALNEYRVRQLIEEAISSSAIEGARPTTRELARQMVREGRKPSTLDERMIFNNWRAMQRILELREEARPLGVDDVLELHRILGENALEIDGAAGVFRTSDDDVRVADAYNEVWHVPPNAEGLEERIAAMLRFADGDDDSHDVFIHPLLRAIIVHFWAGYEHPFRDGNGRVARALYYWCLLRHQYEMGEFLSISGPIDRSPKAYYMAFAYTETDGGDLTYFLLHQLKVMRQAYEELRAHIEARARRIRELQGIIQSFDELNHRQRALLQHAVRHPRESYTIKGHAASHRVHYMTARSDMADLVARGYLEEKRVGKSKRFYSTRRIAKKRSRG